LISNYIAERGPVRLLGPGGEIPVQGANGTGGTRRGKNGEAVAESINFGPLGYWVGFNLRMAQESAFQAFSRARRRSAKAPAASPP